MQNQTQGPAVLPPAMDWSGEINGAGRVIPYNDPAALQEAGMSPNGGSTFMEPNRHADVSNALSGTGMYLDMLNRTGQTIPRAPDMTHNLSPSVIGNPQSNAEAYLGSMKATLERNIGNFIVATFLIGTQGTVSWEGILYSVGNDYITIYQVARDRYIVCDLYSLKYTEFYDTRRRALCNQLLEEQNYGNNASN